MIVSVAYKAAELMLGHIWWTAVMAWEYRTILDLLIDASNKAERALKEAYATHRC